MKNIRYNIGTAPLAALLLPLLAFVYLLAGCTMAQVHATAAADLVANAAELGAGYAIQNKIATMPQLAQLANDLPGVASGVALTPSDNTILAGIIANLSKTKADLTGITALDALNGDIAKINAGGNPTLLTGAEWSQLKDAAVGINAAIAVAQANPSLVPQ
jgi:hypothetical protein